MAISWHVSLSVAACSVSNSGLDGLGGPADARPASTPAATTPTGGVGGTGGGGAAWRPFSAASPWNTPIAAGAAADPNSQSLIADFANVPDQTTFWINIQDYSIPVYWVDAATVPMVTVMAALGGTGFRTGARNDSVAEGRGSAPIPAGAIPAEGDDRHLAIVDRALGKEWDFWDARPAGSTWTAGQAATMDLSGTGVRPPERNDPWWAGHGARACGFPLIAGLITADELRSGAIEHALVVAYPHIRSRYYTPPASTAQGTTDDARPNRGILCGARIQLDPALDVSKLGLSSTGVAIARALQKYGAFVGDYSGAISLYADSSPDAQAAYRAGLLSNDDAEAIPLDRFRLLAIGMTYDNEN